MAETEQSDLATLTVQLLSAYVSNNQLPSTELADLIKTTRTALSGETAPETPAIIEYPPAVSVRKSLGSRDHILSLIDGRPYKTLKRHLANHGLSPAEYRERYELAKDYPMVAPAYSEKRRAVAQALGLGQRRAKAPIEQPEVAVQSVSESVGEVAVTAPKTKATRVSKPQQKKPAPEVTSSSDVGDAEVAKSAGNIAVTPKRRGRPSAGDTRPIENTAAVATPKKRGPKPAQSAPVERPSASSPRVKRKTLTVDAPTQTAAAPVRKGRRKVATA